MSADPISTIRVRKRDGSLAPYDGNEVAASIIDSARGLGDAVARATLLQAEVEITPVSYTHLTLPTKRIV